LICSNSLGQFNYVPNPSFEVYDTCPYFSASSPYGGINYAIPWFQPCTQTNSSDYFNICALNSDFSVPQNVGGYQMAKSGTAYAGIAIRASQNANYREYIEVELIDTLQGNHRYCLSFFVSIANNSEIATDAIHAHLSNNAILQSDLFTVLNLGKTISNTPGLFIQDSLNWVEIKGNFIANGGEKFLLIGNLEDDSLSQPVVVNFGILNAAYYYIDDVSLINCDSLTSISEPDFQKIRLHPNPAQDLLTIDVHAGTNQIAVYSMDGRKVFEFSKIYNSNQELTLDISAYSKGTYILKIINNDQLRTAKFLKM
jgi:OmpA-OmpF porin, OOP family